MCGLNGEEVATTNDVYGSVDEVDNSGSMNDRDSGARHMGMAAETQGGQGATDAEQPPTRMAARDFSA